MGPETRLISNSGVHTYIDETCCVFDAMQMIDQPTKIDQNVILTEHVDGRGFPGQVLVT